MKEQDDKLTLQEVEQLCSLYMDCSLSVLEETELRYLLSQIDYHSPSIDEVRRVMNVDTYISAKQSVKDVARTKRPFRIRKTYIGIAASIAVVIGLAITFWKISTPVGSTESDSYYIAYVEGQRLSDEAARLQVEAGKKAADDFIREMEKIEAQQQQMIDEFFNQ